MRESSFRNVIPKVEDDSSGDQNGMDHGLRSSELDTIDEAKKSSKGGIGSMLKALEIYVLLMKSQNPKHFRRSPALIGKILATLKRMANVLEAQEKVPVIRYAGVSDSLLNSKLPLDKFNKIMKSLDNLCKGQIPEEIYTGAKDGLQAIIQLWQQVTNWIEYYFQNTCRRRSDSSQYPVLAMGMIAARRLGNHVEVLSFGKYLLKHNPDALPNLVYMASAYYHLEDWAK